MPVALSDADLSAWRRIVARLQWRVPGWKCLSIDAFQARIQAQTSPQSAIGCCLIVLTFRQAAFAAVKPPFPTPPHLGR